MGFDYCIILFAAAATIVNLWSPADAFSCGGSAIPYKLVIKPSGLPTLGCAIPSCFGGGQGGVGFDPETERLARNGQGEIRDGDAQRQRQRNPNAPRQQATCQTGVSQSCAGNRQWAGGIKEHTSTDSVLELVCCEYSGLEFSQEVDTFTLEVGDTIEGGEVFENGRQTAFDLIKNIRRSVGPNGKPRYEVTVHRMSCLPDPAAAPPDVENGVGQSLALSLNQPAPAASAPADPAPAAPNVVNPAGDQPPVETGRVQEGVVGPLLRQEFFEVQPVLIRAVAAQAPGDIDDVEVIEALPGGPPVAGPVVEDIEVIEALPGGGGGGEGVFVPLGGGGGACFSGDTIVHTLSGDKPISELVLNEMVLSVEQMLIRYAPVEMFLHRQATQMAKFCRFETNDGRTLKLTDKHLIYVSRSCNPNANDQKRILAEDAQIGDCLFSVDSDERHFHLIQISNITSVIEAGIYAPLTSTGDIIVNRLMASCHTNVMGHSMQQTFLYLIRRLNDIAVYLFGASFSLYDNVNGDVPMGINYVLSIVDILLPKSVLYN